MNKYLIAGVLVALIGGTFYLTRNDVEPKVQADKAVSATTPKYKANVPVTQVSEKTQGVAHSVATVSGGGQQAKIASLAVEQTQNAVDFNAPGAGTAQQKAYAATAATKAYQESRQQMR